MRCVAWCTCVCVKGNQKVPCNCCKSSLLSVKKVKPVLNDATSKEYRLILLGTHVSDNLIGLDAAHLTALQPLLTSGEISEVSNPIVKIVRRDSLWTKRMAKVVKHAVLGHIRINYVKLFVRMIAQLALIFFQIEHSIRFVPTESTLVRQVL